MLPKGQPPEPLNPPAGVRFLNVLSNTEIAELLAQQAERETGILARAFAIRHWKLTATLIDRT
jgi:hypothetical protein